MGQPNANVSWLKAELQKKEKRDLFSGLRQAPRGATAATAFEDQHPELGKLQRAKLKQLAQDFGPRTMASELQKLGFEAVPRDDGELAIRKPGGKFYLIEPKGFKGGISEWFKDIVLDYGPVGLYKDVMWGLGATGGGVAGLALSGGNPVAGYGGGVAGAGAGSAAAEGLHGLVAKLAGIDVEGPEVGKAALKSGATGAALQALLPVAGKAVKGAAKGIRAGSRGATNLALRGLGSKARLLSPTEKRLLKLQALSDAPFTAANLRELEKLGVKTGDLAKLTQEYTGKASGLVPKMKTHNPAHARRLQRLLTQNQLHVGESIGGRYTAPQPSVGGSIGGGYARSSQQGGKSAVSSAENLSARKQLAAAQQRLLMAKKGPERDAAAKEVEKLQALLPKLSAKGPGSGAGKQSRVAPGREGGEAAFQGGMKSIGSAEPHAMKATREGAEEVVKKGELWGGRNTSPLQRECTVYSIKKEAGDVIFVKKPPTAAEMKSARKQGKILITRDADRVASILDDYARSKEPFNITFRKKSGELQTRTAQPIIRPPTLKELRFYVNEPVPSAEGGETLLERIFSHKDIKAIAKQWGMKDTKGKKTSQLKDYIKSIVGSGSDENAALKGKWRRYDPELYNQRLLREVDKPNWFTVRLEHVDAINPVRKGGGRIFRKPPQLRTNISAASNALKLPKAPPKRSTTESGERLLLGSQPYTPFLSAPRRFAAAGAKRAAGQATPKANVGAWFDRVEQPIHYADALTGYTNPIAKALRQGYRARRLVGSADRLGGGWPQGIKQFLSDLARKFKPSAQVRKRLLFLAKIAGKPGFDVAFDKAMDDPEFRQFFEQHSGAIDASQIR